MAVEPDIDLQQYEVTDKDDGTLVFEHKETGKTVTIGDKGGSVSADELWNTYYISPSDDPQAVADDAGAFSHLKFEDGTHEVAITDLETWLRVKHDSVTVEIPSGVRLKIPNNQLDGSENGMEIIQVGDGSGVEPTNVTIRGEGTIDGNATNNADPGTGSLRTVHIEEGCSDIEVSINVRDMHGQVIRPHGASSNIITNVRIHDCHLESVHEGILWTYCEQTVVENNTIDTTTGQDAIEPANGAIGWIVIGNTIIDNTGSAIDAYDGCEEGVITGNVSHNPAGSAIEVGAGSNATKNITIADNVIQGPDDKGIEVFDGSGNTRRIKVKDNLIENPSTYGIDVEANADGTEVIGNTVFIADRGIRAQNGLNDFTISDNRLVACASEGIYIPGGTDGTVNDNRVEGAAANGIFVGATGTSIADNTVRGCDNHGIVVSDKCSVTGNQVYNNGQSGSTYSGIRASGADRVHISGNLVYDDQGTTTQDEGIALLNSVSNSFVQDNMVWGHATNLNDGSAASTDVQNNKLA